MDYTVCLFSEVFVTTQGGNFPHFLMGQRRYLFDGHAKTIKPDKRKLVALLQDMEIRYVTSNALFLVKKVLHFEKVMPVRAFQNFGLGLVLSSRHSDFCQTLNQ